MDQQSDWLTPKQALARLGMSKSTFWRRVAAGKIIGRRDGPRSYRFSAAAIEQYQRNNMTVNP